MKNPANMTTNQIKKWLHKTLLSIHYFKGDMQSKRGMELLDRYQDLVFEIKSSHYDSWVEYCEILGLCTSHDGYDLFAWAYKHIRIF
jgi:hypothetical protein